MGGESLESMTEEESADVPALALLTVEEMYRADAAAVKLGVAGETLMANAGAAIAREIAARWLPRRVIACSATASRR